MRHLLLLVIFLLSALVMGQNQTSSLFSTVKPDVTVVVRQHSTGADLVEITMLDRKYPLDRLRDQVTSLCAEVGTPARGLTVGSVPISDNMHFVKATFATNGIIDRATGRLRIQPFLRAFAGSTPPFTVTGLAMIFDGELPSTQTLQKYRVPEMVESEARFSTFPRGIEYRIKLLTQDPAKISFPDKFEKPKPVPTTVVVKSMNVPLLITLFVVGGLAIGALVYFALLRAGTRSRNKLQP